MERGKWSLDAVFDCAHDWCLATLPVEPVRLGEAQGEVHAIDSSTIVRLRAGTRLALAGKRYRLPARRDQSANGSSGPPQRVVGWRCCRRGVDGPAHLAALRP